MAMNREQKRMQRKLGELGEDGQPVTRPRKAPRSPAPDKREKVGAAQYAREVRSELRKVAWPTREETINYSVVVAIALVFMTSLVFAVDWVFSDAVLRLFE